MSDNKSSAGVIGIASGYLGRYREFGFCVTRTIRPQGSEIVWKIGVNIADSYNSMCEDVLSDDKYEWVWILGDDHTWGRDLLMKLLARNVDVVVPYVLRHSFPYRSVLHTSRDNGFVNVANKALDGYTGLVDISHFTVGNAGMLIRRHVIEAMTDPWFENGKTRSGMGGCDLWFCHKLHEAGFSLHMDLDTYMGHMTTVEVRPHRETDGSYVPEIAEPCGDKIVIDRVTSMQKLMAQLKDRGIVLDKLHALEVYGHTGRMHTMDYHPLVATLDVWEIDASAEDKLIKNLPGANAYILDSYEEVKKTKKKYDLVVVDNPMTDHDGHSEHFDLFPYIFNVLSEQAIIVLNVIPNIDEVTGRQYPTLFNEQHLNRRAEFYGVENPEDISLECMIKTYTDLAQTNGIVVDWWFDIQRSNVYYLVLGVSRKTGGGN